MDKNDKDNFFPGFDAMILKSHLNASFDQDNINVSEDLISRTLQAIKKNKEDNSQADKNQADSNQADSNQTDNNKAGISQEENRQEENRQEKSELHLADKENRDINDKEVIEKVKSGDAKRKFPFERLMQTAAALLILFIGFSVIGNISGKKGSSSSTSMVADTTGTNESTVQDKDITETTPRSSITFKGAADSASSKENSKTTDSLAGSDKTDSSTARKSTSEEKGLAKGASSPNDTTTDVTESAVALTKEPKMGATLASTADTFSAIYSLSQDQIITCTIVDCNLDKVTVDENTDNLVKVFTILDNYKIISADKVTSNTFQYTINMNTKDNQSFTVMVGDGMLIKKNDGINSTEEYYTTEDEAGLLNDLSGLLESISTTSN